MLACDLLGIVRPESAIIPGRSIDPATLTMRTPAASLAGNVQVGRQLPAAAAGASKCLSFGSGGYAMIAAGNRHACALTSGGAAQCWGENWNAQLGNSSVPSSVDITDVFGLTGIGLI